MTNTTSIDQLNQQFGFNTGPNKLSIINGEGDIGRINIENQQATASISLQGAHLLSWIPDNADEVIWLSEQASFASGKSVRGGIPICWPWFGPHESNAQYPAHGFARTVIWQLTNTRALSADETEISFKLETASLDQKYQAMCPQPLTAEYIISIGKRLSMKLITHNNGQQAVSLGQALHTYFKVDDITDTTVRGLENKEYLDKTDDFSRKTQSGPVIIEQEVDRIYLQTADQLIIDNNIRKIIISKQGSESTVVWNPGKAVAEKMGDLGEQGYQKMLCVESANAAEDIRQIEAGQSHQLQVTYEIEG
ncbi:MAG: D-hexose-6-phosphate mutarotase [Gammaproteobacteria bacterium]|nr:D-hexose-6-phosphate mutarotase [Gammaproteobacteria bacterium]